MLDQTMLPEQDILTEFIAGKLEASLMEPPDQNSWKELVGTYRPRKNRVHMTFQGWHNLPREFVGERFIRDWSAYAVEAILKRWELTIGAGQEYVEDQEFEMLDDAIRALGMTAESFESFLFTHYWTSMDGTASTIVPGFPVNPVSPITGANIIADAHSFNGFAFDNLHAGMALTQANLLAGYVLFGDTPNDKGRRLGWMPDAIVTGPALSLTVDTLLDPAPWAPVAATGGSMSNQTARLGLGKIVLPHYSGSKWWLVKRNLPARWRIIQFLRHRLYNSAKFVKLDKPTDYNNFMRFENLYGTVDRMNFAFGPLPQTVHQFNP